MFSRIGNAVRTRANQFQENDRVQRVAWGTAAGTLAILMHAVDGYIRANFPGPFYNRYGQRLSDLYKEPDGSEPSRKN